MKIVAVPLIVVVILLPAAIALDPSGPGGPPVITGHLPSAGTLELEEVPWYERTSMDPDRDRVADVLRPGMDSASEATADLILSFSRDVVDRDLSWLRSRSFDAHAVIPAIDAVTVFDVPFHRIGELFNLEGTVFVEPMGAPILFSDVATPTVRARGSEMYSPFTAWEEGYTGKEVSIAVIDTGIDDEHPSLKGKFLGGVDMTKPDNLDILYPQDGSYNPDDVQGHGSTCSGIATGTGAPDGTFMGAAPDARLVDIRIGTKIGYAPGEFWVGAVSDPHVKDGTLRGIQWGIDNLDTPWPGSGMAGIDVLSLSWGVDVGQDSDGTDAYSRLLDAAVERGAIVVNAAGNDGPSNTGFTGLSASSSAIIVAATDDMDTLEHDDDVIAEYSSRGPRTDDGDGDPFNELKPDIAAPGTHINNLQPDTRYLTGDASSNGYGARGSGTSYATPLVAGVVAMMIEANPDLRGRNDLVKEMLRHTAQRRGQPTSPDLDPFWERDHGWGVVDAYSAVMMSTYVDDPEAIDPDLQAHITSPSYQSLNVTEVAFPGGSRIVIEGLAWSRGDEIDDLEYRIDDGDWRSVLDRNSSGFGPFRLEVKGLETGSHRVWVRSLGSGKESLPDWIDLHVGEGGGIEGAGPSSSTLIVIGVLSAVAALGIAAFILVRKRSSGVRPV